MQVNRKTRNIAKYLGHIQPDESFLLGLAIDTYVEERLKSLGYDFPFIPGQQQLPDARKGPASRRNAEGFDIVHRDQPMETAYRQVEWHWTQFSGRHDAEEKSKLVDVPYKRYPRTFVLPYGIELEIRVRDDGNLFVVTRPFSNTPDQLIIATNTANMLREVIGGFEIFKRDLLSWVSAPVRRLNWQLLPPGKSPWETAQPALEEMVKRATKGNQNVLRARLAAVGEKNPDFVAIGMAGFQGYTVFGFVQKGLCILECPKVNNASYVLPLDSWESISQMTKAQILSAHAHQARLIHTRQWFGALDKVLSAGREAA